MLMDACKETRLLLIFCTNLTLELRASYHRLSWGMKPGSTILNLNQSDDIPAKMEKFKHVLSAEEVWVHFFGMK